MKRYLLFDLDGTLTDPKVGITTCVQYALASFGIEEPDLDKLEPFIGPPLKDSFMQFYGMDGAKAEAAVEKYRERFRDTGIFENRIYRGVPKMLRDLSKKGMKLAVASSKPTVFVERILKHFGIDRYFAVAVGSELDGTRVEKAQVVEEALRQLFGEKPVEKDQVYMIGDRRFDVEGARAQGIESVGVAYGYGSMEELKEAKADYIVRSVEELHRFLLRETKEPGESAVSRRIWRLLCPVLLFFCVNGLVSCLLQILLAGAGRRVQGGAFFFLRDEGGNLSGFTGNAWAVISAVSYLAATLSVRAAVRERLLETAEEMKLSHLKREPKGNYVILGILTVCAVLGLNLLLELFKVAQSSESYRIVRENQFSAGLFLGLVSYGLISPIAEELIFRGVVYGCFRQMMDRRIAAVFSALLFGLYHGNMVQGIYAALMGCLMAYAYEYFGSFRAPLAIHIAANVMAYGMSFMGTAPGGMVSWPLCLAFLAVAAGEFWLLHRQRKVF